MQQEKNQLSQKIIRNISAQDTVCAMTAAKVSYVYVQCAGAANQKLHLLDPGEAITTY